MKSTILTAIAIGLSALLSHGQTVPAAINYQGRVTDSTGTGLGTGTPVNRVMIFRLYGTATGGNPIWSEQQTVTLADGEFSVLLGTGIEASFGDTARPSLLNAFAGSDRFLEIVVDNGDGTLNAADVPIAPRQRLTSTAYALRAATADSVASGTDLNLRDANHGLGWYGSDRLFNGQNINGPVLYGFGGGALGSNQNGTQNTALRWDATGNVGIGTAARSDTKLTISGKLGLFDGATRSKNAGISTELGGAIINMGVNEDSGNRFGGNYDSSTQGGMLRFDSRNGTNLFSVLGRPAGSTAAVSPLMIVNSDGKVGIGTTNPSQTLDVAGSIRVGNGATAPPTNSPSGGAGSRLIMWPGNANETPFGFGISDSTLWSSVPDSGTFRWFGGTTERMSLVGNTGVLYVGGLVASKISFLNDETQGIAKRNTFGGVAIDGPAVYGWTKGALGTTIGGEKTALTWDQGQNVKVKGALDVVGAVKAKDKPVTVGEEELRIVRGILMGAPNAPNTFTTSPHNAGGLELRGSGYRLKSEGNGTYFIEFVQPFSDVPSFTVTPFLLHGEERQFAKIWSASTHEVRIEFRNDGGPASGHTNFHFIAVGPR